MCLQAKLQHFACMYKIIAIQDDVESNLKRNLKREISLKSECDKIKQEKWNGKIKGEIYKRLEETDANSFCSASNRTKDIIKKIEIIIYLVKSNRIQRMTHNEKK